MCGPMQLHRVQIYWPLEVRTPPLKSGYYICMVPWQLHIEKRMYKIAPEMS